jgi:N-acetylneuraminate lyase
MQDEFEREWKKDEGECEMKLSSKSRNYHGVFVALCSCYDDKGNINPDAVRRLVRYYMEKNVNGLYVGGSTGEGVLQTVEERKLVLEAACAEAKGEIAIIAHVGAITTKDSVELAAHAGASGADAISSIAPFYFNYREQDVKQYWLDIMEAGKLPFIIYNFPASTGFQVTGSLLKEMLAYDLLFGIKNTSLNVHDLQQFKAIGGPEFLVFNGPDQQYLAGRMMGASGGIGSTYGAMPELYLKMESEFRNGRNEEAQYWQYAVNEIIPQLHKVGALAAIKAIIRLRSGIDCGSPRSPLPSITQETYPAVVKLAETIERFAEQAKNGERIPLA